MSVSVNLLCVAGGGGGSSSGGGAGGFIETTHSLSFSDAYPVNVGTGGTGGARGDTNAGGNGGNSSVFTFTAIGGAGGVPNNSNGTSGGSGSGGAANGGGTTTGGSGTSGQGNSGGGNGGNLASPYPAGGGGGSGSGGSNATASSGGNGGSGTASSITGTSVTYAGGGGGGTAAGGGTGGTGGNGGGGNGSSGGAGSNATANTGGGGGGAGSTSSGGNGGSGIVVISYVTGTLTATGGTVTTSGGNTIHTFTSSGTFSVSSLPTQPKATIGEYFGASLKLKFNGDSLDSSGNGFDASAANIAFVPGKSGSACAEFNGTNSKESVPFNATLNSSGAMTFGGLFNFDSLTGTKYLAMRGNLSVDWGLSAQSSSGLIEFLTHTAPSDNYLSSGFTATVGKWHFLVFRFVPGEMSVFVDGDKVATLSVGSATRTSASYGWTIGDNYSGGNSFDGKIDAFFIEARGWSDAEIRKRATDFQGRFAIL